MNSKEDINRFGKRISTSLLAMVLVLLSIAVSMIAPAAAAPPVPPGEEGIYYFVPQDTTAQYCDTVTIDVWVNSSIPIRSGSVVILSDLIGCGEIVDCEYNSTEWTTSGTQVIWNSTTNYNAAGDVYIHEGHKAMMTFYELYEKPAGCYPVGEIEVHCNCTSGCLTNLTFDASTLELYITNNTNDYDIVGQNGTFECQGPINVDIRADSITGNIFDVSSYTVNPGTVTEDGITINNQTAMGAMVVYCQDNGINVNITMGTWGEYVLQIGNNASDYNNWCYAVDEVVPWVGGAAYSLSGGEKVHWYNCGLNYYTVLTTLNTSSIEVGDYLNATVTWKNVSGTYPLDGAEVFVSDTAYMPGTSVGTTGSDGNVTFQWSTPGVWYVYAVDPVHGSGIYNYPPASFTCSGVYITVDAPDECIPRQSQFNVDIKVNPNNLEVYGAQYVLSFNSSVLRAETQVKGPFLTADGNDSMVIINTVDNTPGAGETEYSETRKNIADGVTDPGVLATITFTAIGDVGTSSWLNLSEVIVSNPTPEAMPDTWIVLENDEIEICINEPPVANAIVYDDYNNVGSKYLCKVYFNASGSYDQDPDGAITYYRWDFGDGDYGTGMIKEHVYTSWNWNGPDEPGDYYEPFNVSLTVTDDTPEPETGTNTTYFDVIVYIAGDANGDGIVNIIDASMVGLEWQHTCTPPGTCWRDTTYDGRADKADLNNDHEVNILDAVIIGTTWKHTAWGDV